MSTVKVSESSKPKKTALDKDGGRTYVKDLKDISSILTLSSNSLSHVEDSVKKIQESVDKIVANTSNEATASSTQAKTDEKNNNKSIMENLSGLGKSIKDFLFSSKTNNEKNSKGFFSSVLTGIKWIGTLALTALPLLFTDALSNLFKNVLTTVGVGEDTANLIAENMTPAIQGAAIGYGLTHTAKGAIAGALFGILNHQINEFANDAKKYLNENTDETDDASLGVLLANAGLDVGIYTLKGMLAGALIGAQFGKMGLGAAIGAAAGPIWMISEDISNHLETGQEMEAEDYLRNTLGGSVTGIIAGAAFGAKFGIWGIAAGAIIGGLGGLVSTWIADAKIRRKAADDSSRELSTKFGLNATDKRFLNEEDKQQINKDIAEQQKIIDDLNYTKDQRKEAEKQVEKLKSKLDVDLRTKLYQQRKEALSSIDFLSNSSGEDLWWYTRSGAIVSRNDVSFDKATELYLQNKLGYTKEEIKYLQDHQYNDRYNTYTNARQYVKNLIQSQDWYDRLYTNAPDRSHIIGSYSKWNMGTGAGIIGQDNEEVQKLYKSINSDKPQVTLVTTIPEKLKNNPELKARIERSMQNSATQTELLTDIRDALVNKKENNTVDTVFYGGSSTTKSGNQMQNNGSIQRAGK